MERRIHFSLKIFSVNLTKVENHEVTTVSPLLLAAHWPLSRLPGQVKPAKNLVGEAQEQSEASHGFEQAQLPIKTNK